MPNLDAELAEYAGQICFATMEFCNAYWQTPLEKETQEGFGIIAPQGVLTSTRALHGLKNSTVHFQAHVLECFQSMQGASQSWHDNFVLYVDNVDRLLKHLETFLSICNAYNLKVCTRKSQLF